MEMKLSQSLMNARGQGHLVTLAKVINFWAEKFW